MSRLVLAMTTSLDGFATGPDISIEDVGGSNIAQQFVNAGLIDEIRLSIAHILLGEGVRLFDQLAVVPGLETMYSESARWRLTWCSKQFPSRAARPSHG